MQAVDLNCSECPFRAVTLYAPLLEEDIATLRAEQQSRSLAARTMIHREGEAPDEIYSLREGWAFRFRLLPNGRRQILSLLLPGDLVTLQAMRRLPLWFSVQTVTPVVLCAFKADAFARTVAQSAALMQRAEESCVNETLAMDERIIDLGRRSAVERMARLLLNIHARLTQRGNSDGEGGVPFYLRQEHMADLLGLTPVHVSRTLTDLRNRGLIALCKQRLVVKDGTRLKQAGGVSEENYAIKVLSPVEASI